MCDVCEVYEVYEVYERYTVPQVKSIEDKTVINVTSIVTLAWLSMNGTGRRSRTGYLFEQGVLVEGDMPRPQTFRCAALILYHTVGSIHQYIYVYQVYHYEV